MDTHSLLWWLTGREHLSRAAAEAVAAPENEVLVSPVSIWEISIKRSLGRLDAPDNLLRHIERQDLTELPIRKVHADVAGSLPPHHSDPFDRMLVAQARVEGLTLVTRDRRLAAYGVAILEA